jgi:hypothetical protein
MARLTVLLALHCHTTTAETHKQRAPLCVGFDVPSGRTVQNKVHVISHVVDRTRCCFLTLSSCVRAASSEHSSIFINTDKTIPDVT